MGDKSSLASILSSHLAADLISLGVIQGLMTFLYLSGTGFMCLNTTKLTTEQDRLELSAVTPPVFQTGVDPSPRHAPMETRASYSLATLPFCRRLRSIARSRVICGAMGSRTRPLFRAINFQD